MKNKFSEEVVEKKAPRKRKPNKLFKGVLALVNGEALTRDGMIKNLPFIMYLALVVVGYIAYGYWSDETLRGTRKLEVEIEELNSELITVGRELNLASRQSQIADSVLVMGLKESTGKIKKITLINSK